jgi:hypothetical protein
MAELSNFPLLFDQIGHYLKIATEHPKELQTAREAFNTIVGTVYFNLHQEKAKSGQCSYLSPIVKNFF